MISIQEFLNIKKDINVILNDRQNKLLNEEIPDNEIWYTVINDEEIKKSMLTIVKNTNHPNNIVKCKYDKKTGIGKIIFESKLVSIPCSMFRFCDILKSVRIPNKVVDIKESAFERCLNLEQVILGEHVVYIGVNAFNNCGRLKKINLSKFKQSLSAFSFRKCESLPEDIKTLIRKNNINAI